MKISLVIPSLGCGGAERVLTTMANYWSNHGNEVSLITIDSIENDFYELDYRVKRIGLDLVISANSLCSAIYNNITRISFLRRELKELKPDFVISFIDHMNVMTLLSTVGIDIKVVVSERIDPREHHIGRIKGLLRNYVYPLTNALVIQTDSLKEWAHEIVSEKCVYVIPNPLPQIEKVSNDDSMIAIDTPFIIGMGRLVSQKGFDILIQAFSRCLQNNTNWTLLILGEGSDRDKLEKLSNDLGVGSRVLMPGRVQNQISILKQASIFVLSSRYEGFPNALLEAMCCGLPVISFDCPTGPADIIINNENGKLVPSGDIDMLVSVMSDLMNDDNERKRLSKQAAMISNEYSLTNIMILWEKMLDDLV
ncbi:MAG: glycosyltransferase family 4 protein [Methylococcales bacterium]